MYRTAPRSIFLVFKSQDRVIGCWPVNSPQLPFLKLIGHIKEK